jgi:hypothetical protein
MVTMILQDHGEPVCAKPVKGIQGVFVTKWKPIHPVEKKSRGNLLATGQGAYTIFCGLWAAQPFHEFFYIVFQLHPLPFPG